MLVPYRFVRRTRHPTFVFFFLRGCECLFPCSGLCTARRVVAVPCRFLAFGSSPALSSLYCVRLPFDVLIDQSSLLVNESRDFQVFAAVFFRHAPAASANRQIVTHSDSRPPHPLPHRNELPIHHALQLQRRELKALHAPCGRDGLAVSPAPTSPLSWPRTRDRYERAAGPPEPVPILRLVAVARFNL